MANPYPADIQDGAGNVRISGKVNFTDPDNQPGTGGSQPGITAYTVTLADVLAGAEQTAASATATGQFSGAMTYTAIPNGINGNDISVITGTASVGALTVEVSGRTIILHLVQAGDTVLSTFAEVKTAIEGTPAAAALVTVGAITGGGTSVYDAGDAYLVGGITRFSLGEIAAGTVIYDAAVFMPEAWDGATTFIVSPLSFADSLDPSAADEASDETFVSQQPLFDLAFRQRAPVGVSVVMTASSDGAVPSTGEMLVLIDVRTPA